MAKKTQKITIARSAITGKFVTADYARRNPRITEVEHYKKVPAKK